MESQLNHNVSAGYIAWCDTCIAYICPPTKACKRDRRFLAIVGSDRHCHVTICNAAFDPHLHRSSISIDSLNVTTALCPRKSPALRWSSMIQTLHTEPASSGMPTATRWTKTNRPQPQTSNLRDQMAREARVSIYTPIVYRSLKYTTQLRRHPLPQLRYIALM
jgi:hypothetical protein